jgi:Fic family protein
MPIPYIKPDRWLKYDKMALVDALTDAKAAVLSLASMPYQRSWAETLQQMELKREVAGTSKIEGADFTDRELDVALADEGTETGALTRSQRQARAAKRAYEWIADLPKDRPIDRELIFAVHRLIVTGCDDDHCEPGALRGQDQNVTFGRPSHRGAAGGMECREAFDALCGALGQEFRGHDPLIQALALHYHLGAMHPFQDGNGRTARALEALMLQRARLKDDLFIAMSNYYYDEKDRYLAILAEARSNGFDLTLFLKFGLEGIHTQCRRLLEEIRGQVWKSLFRDVMGRMYGRLLSTRKRGLARRQLAILEQLLSEEAPIEHILLYHLIDHEYRALKGAETAFIRDLNYLLGLGAITIESVDIDKDEAFMISVRLEWATEITETAFYEELEKMPEAKSRLIPSTR